MTINYTKSDSCGVKFAELIFTSLMFIAVVIAIVILKINTHKASDIDNMDCKIVDIEPVIVKICTEKTNAQM